MSNVPCHCYEDTETLEACRQGDCADARKRQARIDATEAAADALGDQQRDDRLQK
jgi:uncharacterized protein Yka (UPF0111/DUF47 family)